MKFRPLSESYFEKNMRVNMIQPIGPETAWQQCGMEGNRAKKLT